MVQLSAHCSGCFMLVSAAQTRLLSCWEEVVSEGESKPQISRKNDCTEKPCEQGSWEEAGVSSEVVLKCAGRAADTQLQGNRSRKCSCVTCLTSQTRPTIAGVSLWGTGAVHWCSTLGDYFRSPRAFSVVGTCPRTEEEFTVSHCCLH